MAEGDARRWERLKVLFDEALDLGPEGRAELLARTSAEDAALGQELGALLAAHERQDGLMAEPTLSAEDWGASPPPRSDSPLPTSIGRYAIRSLLGVGGMGEVYLAHDPRLDREVALKVLPAGLARRPRRRERFLREARAAASLNHPNITTIHEIVEADGRDAIAFELVPGRTLRERLASGPLPLGELLDVALPLADALAYAHDRGVVHRDLKPANVMVSERGPKLLDFGLALSVRGGEEAGERGEEPLDGALAGTPSAMSPEQARGEVVDARSDVFAFGSLLFELATGRPAFAGKNVAATIEAVLHEEPPPLRSLRPELPAALEEITGRALRKDPAQRYARIADLAADLRRLAGRRRAPRPLALLGLAAALVAVVLLARGWRGGAAEPGRHEVAAVMDFENVADPQDSDRLAAMLGPLLGAQISAVGDLAVLSDQRLHDVARQFGDTDGRIDRAMATDVARKAGADTMVLGRVTRVGGSLVATADVVEVEGGRTLAAVQAHGGSAADVFSMAESLGRQVRETLRRPAISAAEQQALAAQLTSSVDAFRAYVRGLQALEQNNPAGAAAALQEATSTDPAFALAQLRLSMALIWTGNYEESTRALSRALAFRDKLPQDMLLIADALSGPDDASGLPIYVELLERDPFQHDALYLAGEIWTHSPTRNDAKQAAGAYERLLDLDPRLSLVYDHMLCAYLRLGRFDAARERLAAWERLGAPNLAELQAQFALWEGRFDEAAVLLPSPLEAEFLAGRDDAPAVRAVRVSDVETLRAGVGDANGLHLLLELDLRANILAAYGRFDDAAELYRQATKIPGKVVHDGFLTSMRSSEHVRLAFLLSALGDTAGARRELEGVLQTQPRSYRWLWIAGLFAARDGDLPTARARLATLSGQCERGESPSGTLYRDALAAELALAEGRAAEARDGFSALVGSGRLMEDWYAYEDSPAPLLRDGLARACLALGDTAGASAALAGLIDSGFERLRHPVTWTLALAQRGALELQLGHEPEGRALLERFMQHWAEADHLLPVVTKSIELLRGY